MICIFSDEVTDSRLQEPEVVLQSLQITRSFYLVYNERKQKLFVVSIFLSEFIYTLE